MEPPPNVVLKGLTVLQACEVMDSTTRMCVLQMKTHDLPFQAGSGNVGVGVMSLTPC